MLINIQQVFIREDNWIYHKKILIVRHENLNINFYRHIPTIETLLGIFPVRSLGLVKLLRISAWQTEHPVAPL